MIAINVIVTYHLLKILFLLAWLIITIYHCCSEEVDMYSRVTNYTTFLTSRIATVLKLCDTHSYTNGRMALIRNNIALPLQSTVQCLHAKPFLHTDGRAIRGNFGLRFRRNALYKYHKDIELINSTQLYSSGR